MVKKLNPSFVEYFAAYLKTLLSNKDSIITAEQFQEQVTAAANKYLSENYGTDPSDVRSAIAQSTPESECANAKKARKLYEIGYDNRITDYKTQTEIGLVTREDSEAALAQAITNHPDVTDWTSSTNISLPDTRPGKEGKKKQTIVKFRPGRAAYCGNCWICNTDVMSYSGFSNELYNAQEYQVKTDTPGASRIECTTPCGDCEHVSAIMASYIAGMLKSGGFAKFYWASYYVACVECNRRKSNYIGVKLNATNGWEVDDNGINAIVDVIFPNATIEPHASEYNPIRNALTAKYNLMSADKQIAFRDTVRKYIVDGTQTWCDSANENMTKGTEKTKHIKMSFNVSKIIVAITGHLNVITGPLEKRAKKGKPGPGNASGTGKKRGKVAKSAQGALQKPKPVKRRGGGPDDTEDSDTQNTDTTGSQYTDTESSQALDTKKEEEAPSKTVDDNRMTVEPDVKDTPILQWYNLIGEAEIDYEDDDDYDEYDDKEDDDEFNDRIRKYHEVIVEFIGNTYGRLLFKQYESDKMIFEELMINLSNSMADILKPLTDTGPVASSSAKTAAGQETKKVIEEDAAILTLPAATEETTPPATPPAATEETTPPATPPAATEETTPPATVTPAKRGRQVGENSQESQEQEDAAILNPPATPPAATEETTPPATVTPAKRGRQVGENSQESQEQDDTEIAKITKNASATDESVVQPSKVAKTERRYTPTVGDGSDSDHGGSRLNKRQSKNRTKRISYIKHKQTRKNQHSRKTK